MSRGPIWSRAWGGHGPCEARGVLAAPDGTIYVTGWFRGTVDFDPGAGERSVTASTNSGMFLSHFDGEGELLRTLTWISQDQPTLDRWGNEGLALATDANGSVYLGGQYSGVIDFDPGTGVRQDRAPGGFDAFVMKLTSDLELEWRATWNSTDRGKVTSIAVVGDGVYTGGPFSAEADLDPGPGIDTRQATPPDIEGFATQVDCALVALNTDGTLRWARTWGDRLLDENCSADASTDLAVVGGTSQIGATVGDDGSMARVGPGGWMIGFHPDGSVLWTTPLPAGITMATVVPGGGAAAGGKFRGTADFATAGMSSEYDAGESPDAHVVRLGDDGVAAWARTWGESGEAWTIAIDADDHAILGAGQFSGQVDFDGELAGAERGAAFVRAFDLEGRAIWARTVSGGASYAAGVSVGGATAAVVGAFLDRADFDFGQGPDVWSSPGLDACWLVRFPNPGD